MSQFVHNFITLQTHTDPPDRGIMSSQGKMYSSFFMIYHLHLSADTVIKFGIIIYHPDQVSFFCPFFIMAPLQQVLIAPLCNKVTTLISFI